MRHSTCLTTAALMCIAAGCNDDDDRVREYRGDRDVYVQQPVAQQVQYEYEAQPIVVQQAPPPIIVERIPPPPQPNYVWRSGYHRYSGNRFVWVNGNYAPPRPGHAWAQPEWHRGNRGYEFRPGQWRPQNDNNRDNRGGNWNNNRRDNDRDGRGDNDRDGRRDGRGDNRVDGRGDNRRDNNR